MIEVKEQWQKLKNILFARQQAYTVVFDAKNQMAKTVLEDLDKFCRASETTFHPDARLHALMEGRREVWLRIQHHLTMNADDLWKMYGRKELEQ